MKTIPLFFRMCTQVVIFSLTILIMRFIITHTSYVQAAEELTFDSSAIPQVDLRIPKKPKLIAMISEAIHGAPPEEDRSPEAKDKMLRNACKGDEKCFCISKAIFIMDSDFSTALNPNGTPSVGTRFLNPGNMRPPSKWNPSVPHESVQVPGNGWFLKFNTLEDGIKANVETYFRNYADYTSARAIVRDWANSSNPNYVNMVATCF